MEELRLKKIALVLTTIAGDDAAGALARALVAERLAACVNVLPAMTSIYRWKGAIEQESERLLLIKTAADRLPDLERRLHELHPYELPEFVVLEPGGGSDAYWEWVTSETRADAGR